MTVAKILLGTVALSIWLAVGVCAADPVVERGLTHSEQDRAMIERAIGRVAKLISDQGPTLNASWRVSKGEAAEVPVYLVEGRPNTIVTPAAVPSGCHCVFVSPSVLQEWISRNSTGPGRLKLDAEHFLVFILMHEVGHLNKGTHAAAFRNGEMSQLNIEPRKAKVAEEDADDFAADLLKSRANQAMVNDRSLSANWVINELSKISWNMQALRTLDKFGAFSVGKPSVFFDNGYTHPNLAWRILRINDRIQGTKESKYLLDAFEEARDRGANPQPLYQRK